MKLNGFVGKGTGKLGASVFAICGGEQIVRQYNPQVSNPNTAAQIEQRAKLKLMSQLASVFSPVLAIAKQGLKSARNLFISKNFIFTAFENGKASVEYLKLQLTTGNSLLDGFAVSLTGEGEIRAAVSSTMANTIANMVYCLFWLNQDDKLVFIESKVAEKGTNNDFRAEFEADGGEKYVVYGYGVIDKQSGASSTYGNYEVESAEHLASLIASRALTSANIATTATSAQEIEVTGN